MVEGERLEEFDTGGKPNVEDRTDSRIMCRSGG